MMKHVMPRKRGGEGGGGGRGLGDPVRRGDFENHVFLCAEIKLVVNLL